MILLITILALAFSKLSGVRRELTTLRREMDFRVEKRLSEEEDRIREETLKRSRATLKGLVAEQMVPFLDAFRYAPSDARFIGSPIDYIIFDGLSGPAAGGSDRPLTVILADVKTGPAARLTRGQRMIREAVEEGRVEWETIRVGEHAGHERGGRDP